MTMPPGPTPGYDPAHGAYDAPQPASRPRTSLAVAMEQSRNRLMVTAAMVVLGFTAISAKLTDATLFAQGAEPRPHLAARADAPLVSRADIVDRNGNLLATSLATQSAYADPKLISRPEETARKLTSVLPDLDYKELLTKLSGDKRFVWIKRNLTPRQQALVHRLGLPGISFEREERRFYPAGKLTSHVVGYTGLDDNGLAGLEQRFNKRLMTDPHPLRTSIDLRLQHVLHREMEDTVKKFSAEGAAGIIYDVRTAEVLAMVSVPDFDPLDPTALDKETLFNRASLGVYEMGSTFKIFNTAMSLDSGKVRITDAFDASKGIQIGRFTIRDYHNLHRALTVPEIFEYSSNIGSAHMAMTAGVPTQKAFMTKMGFTRPTTLELPEDGWPLVPNPWRDVNAMTIAFGHGISVSPMHTVAAAAAMINGGILRQPTILKRDTAEIPAGERVISTKTSDLMRRLFRYVVTDGTAKTAFKETAGVRGYIVGGKTGTADKLKGRHYVRNARMSSFLGAFPMQDPRYIVYILVDDPKGIKETYGFATGGWVGAPAVANVVKQIAPLLGVPTFDDANPAIIAATYINAAGQTVPPPPPPQQPAQAKGSTVASVPSAVLNKPR